MSNASDFVIENGVLTEYNDPVEKWWCRRV